MKNSTQHRTLLFSSPSSFFLIVVVSIFLAEAADMLFLRFLSMQSYWVEVVIDASLLVFLVSPVLYGYLYKPMATQVKALERMTDLLRSNDEEQFKAIVHASLDGFWITDIQGRFLDVNDTYCKLIGYSHSEMLNMSVTDVEASESPVEVTQHIRRVIEVGRDRFVTHHRSKTGDILDIEVSANYVNLYGGRFYCFLRDITERNRIQVKLEQSLRVIEEQENSFRTLVENTPDTIARYDHACRRTYVNPALLRQIGRPMDEILGKTPEECSVSSYDISNYQSKIREAWETGLIGSHLLEWQNAGGMRIYTDIRIVPERNLDGKVFSVFGIGSDVTERKHAELALRESNQQLSTLLNSMAEGAYGVDNNGNCIFVNASFLQLLGYESADEVLGKHIHELIHHSYADGSHYPATECQMYIAYQRNEKIHVLDEVFWRKDGKAVPVEYWSHPLATDGIVGGAIATFIDITERRAMEKALKESEQRLRTIIETEPECIKVIDNRGCLLEMNAAGLAMLEADSLEEAQRYSLLEYVEPEDRAAFLSLHRRVMHGGNGILEFKIKGLKGTTRYLETHATPMRDANGEIAFLLGITRDITVRKQSEQQLRIAATAFESQEGMLITDADGNILRVNNAFTEITGYSSEEVIGKNPRILSSGQHDSAFYEEMWKCIQNTSAWDGEIWNRRKNGEIYPEHLNITAVKDVDGKLTNYVASLTDITMSKVAAEKIERLAFYDPLTLLPNRRLLMDRLKQAIVSCERSGKTGALLFIDLDHFKTLNDTLGHDTGDLLLKKVAERLESSVREGDTVARLGGDEFVVMLEDLSDHSIEAAALAKVIGEKLLSSLNEPYQLNDYLYHSTPSIGIAVITSAEHGIEDLLKHADIAMYQAKKAGRNTLRFFDPQMQADINSRADMERELRKAVDMHQYQLYYQIQVDGRGHAFGAEALIRWIHPERGMISPAQFIPLAEETGLILTIGNWVLETACAQLGAWKEHELTRDLVLSVNVSAKQFRQTNFASQLSKVLRAYDIQPGQLKLELTESMLLEDIEDTIATMNILKEIGVQFSLDDFGTGYSSLQYLKRLPLSQLKIDQSFVRDISIDSQDRSIVRTIIAMARSLELNVIAEGVETEDQRQRLINKGCNHFQGYLFGRPIPIGEFEALLNQSCEKLM